jgi:hypothetical protein
MKGDPSNLMSLPSPLGKPFFFGIPVKMMTGWLFDCNMGVAHFSIKWQGWAYMEAGSLWKFISFSKCAP